MVSIVDSFRINNEHEMINNKLINTILSKEKNVKMYSYLNRTFCQLME